MATNGIKSNSVCRMPDGTMRRLDSLNEQEYDEFVERCRSRMERALQDYINTHPGSFEQIAEALRKLREENQDCA